MSNFLLNFNATKSVPISEEIIQEYEEIVPSYLREIWRSEGCGKYNNGLIELIHPKNYEAMLWQWLGRENPRYAPIAIDGFGNLFYFKNLPQDAFNKEAGLTEEVCLIDIQFRSITHLTWSLTDFFENWLVSKENQNEWLKVDLFDEAIKQYGDLERDEIFTLVPSMPFGGEFKVENLKKGNALVYQDIMFQF